MAGDVGQTAENKTQETLHPSEEKIPQAEKPTNTAKRFITRRLNAVGGSITSSAGLSDRADSADMRAELTRLLTRGGADGMVTEGYVSAILTRVEAPIRAKLAR